MAATNETKDATLTSTIDTRSGSASTLSNNEKPSTPDNKIQPPPPHHDSAGPDDLEARAEHEGYILDEAAIRAAYNLPPGAPLKKSADGKVVLIPQPTDLPQDPLNWSSWRKAAVLAVLAANAFTADYTAATGASALLPQAEEWGISPDTVNHATAGNTFMLGIGGLLTVWLSAWIGRLPVLFWFGVLSAATAAWAAAAQSFESYMAARILNGVFCVAAAGGGLMWIKDVWFFHEHPRKVNVWSTAIILSPFLGPQFMAAIVSVASWRVGMWLAFGIIGFGLLMTVGLGEETFWPRHVVGEREVRRGERRWMRLVGVEQYRSNWTTNGFWESGMRLVVTLTRVPVLLVCLFYFLDCKFVVMAELWMCC
jgi:MFS family permease